MIVLVVLSMISRGFSRRFLRLFFTSDFFSTWLVIFCFVVDVLFLPLTSFTVRHSNLDGPSNIVFLILLIWPLMYSGCSFFVFCFWYILILSRLS